MSLCGVPRRESAKPAWTYDRIGNRLTETHSGTTDTYTYTYTYTYQLVPPSGNGHSPILSSVALGAGGTKTYQYDPAGNLKQITQGTASTAFTNDDASHLAALTATSPAKGVAFTYDGRDYLTLADTSALPFLDSFETGDVCAWSAALGLPALPTCPTLPAVHPTYSSAGLLHALQRATAPQRSYVFHFAGRPVAQMDLTGTTESWKLLTVDHLGTPIAATGTSGTVLWKGGFEPFGADWNGAGGAGVFLRFPGQWEEGVWEQSSSEKLHYNLRRWYQVGTGRYVQPDPLGSPSDPFYTYAFSRPLFFVDPLGLRYCVPSLGSTRTGVIGIISHHLRGIFTSAPPPPDTAGDFNLIHFKVTCPCPKVIDVRSFSYSTTDGSPTAQFWWSWLP